MPSSKEHLLMRVEMHFQSWQARSLIVANLVERKFSTLYDKLTSTARQMNGDGGHRRVRQRLER